MPAMASFVGGEFSPRGWDTWGPWRQQGLLSKWVPLPHIRLCSSRAEHNMSSILGPLGMCELVAVSGLKMVLSTFLSPWGFRLLDKLTGDKPQCKFMLYFGSRVKPDPTIPQTWFFFFIYLNPCPQLPLLSFIFYTCFTCVYVCIAGVSLVLEEVGRAHQILWDWSYRPSWGTMCWESKLGPLQEQAFLTTELPPNPTSIMKS